MMLEGIRLFIRGLRRAINQPFQELNRWQRAARFAYDLGKYGGRQLREDRAPQMASALAFRTLFGLAPILVVTTILIKAIKGPQLIIDTLHGLLVAAGLDKLQVGAVPEAGMDAPVGSVTLAEWLENLTSQLINADMSAAGIVGFAVIVYAAIGLMVTIENSFNTIYRAPDGRPWSRRLTLYWFILTISPMLIGLTSYANDMFTKWIVSVEAWHFVLQAVRNIWSFGIAWLFTVGVYMLIPNSIVRVRPAMAGALATTTLLWVGKNTLGVYLGNVFAINQLYGSLGLVPLFMFWVYLMWLAVLFGLEVSAILQLLQGRSLEEMDPPRARTELSDPTNVLTLMEVVSEGFVNGRPVATQSLVEQTMLPLATVKKVVDRLVNEGWLHRVSRPEAAITLARPPEHIKADELLKLGYDIIDRGEQGRSSLLAKQLREAQQKAAAGINMSMLVPAAKL